MLSKPPNQNAHKQKNEPTHSHNSPVVAIVVLGGFARTQVVSSPLHNLSIVVSVPIAR